MLDVVADRGNTNGTVTGTSSVGKATISSGGKFAPGSGHQKTAGAAPVTPRLLTHCGAGSES
jgi:hypothetical protein